MLKLLVALGLVAAAAAACVDKSHCKADWYRYCQGTKWVRDDCPNVCKLCNGGGNGGSSCNDKSHCKSEWQKYCAATKWVRDDCPKLCGKCSGGNGGNGGNKGQCGISKVSQGRVVNGQEAQPGAWPWIVSLQSSSGFHFCGGSILTPNWILTASHCVDRNKNNPGYFNVVVGAHDKTQRESTQQRSIGKRVIMHPNYGQGGALNADVALIELRTPLRLNDRVVRACMPQQGVYPQAGKNCYIAGWGATSHPSRGAPPKLQQAKLPVVQSPHKGCHNNREVVCVGLGFGSQSDGKQHPNACRGDSGGPLMCQQSNGSWTVEGVASYVYTYCKYYTAYAPVNKYLSWIKQYVRDL